MPSLAAFRALFRTLGRPTPRASACASCPLACCRQGLRATVVCIACHALDAQRLRALGLFEGATVGVVDTRNGMVLEVRGARLALGAEVVAGITVRPAGA